MHAASCTLRWVAVILSCTAPGSHAPPCSSQQAGLCQQRARHAPRRATTSAMTCTSHAPAVAPERARGPRLHVHPGRRLRGLRRGVDVRGCAAVAPHPQHPLRHLPPARARLTGQHVRHIGAGMRSQMKGTVSHAWHKHALQTNEQYTAARNACWATPRRSCWAETRRHARMRSQRPDHFANVSSFPMASSLMLQSELFPGLRPHTAH